MSDDAVASVGFIGLGAMGGAMARRIIDGGWRTVLWARRPEALDEFDHELVQRAASPAAVGRSVDLVGVCVWADDDVREVCAGDGGLFAGCRPGTIVAIHSTVSPSTVRELAAQAATRQIELLDAPVSGGHHVALDGALALAVGGDEVVLARSRPVFDTFADTISFLGGVGAGQLAKLINNATLAANIVIADDALTLGDALGLDAAALSRFLGEGSGRSYALGVAEVVRLDPDARAEASTALTKDVDRLAREAELMPDPWLLLRTATETLRRLGDPPSGWR